jgi:hypothetical protein
MLACAVAGIIARLMHQAGLDARPADSEEPAP